MVSWVCVLIWEAGSTDTERNMLRELMTRGKFLLEELRSLCQNVPFFFFNLFCLFILQFYQLPLV